MKFLTSVDLQQNILSNAAIDHASSPPSSPVVGQIYFDTTENAIGVFNGTSWVYGSTITTFPWSSITNTPTTLSGYGITDAQSQITASGILKGDGAGGVSAATAGTDYQAPITGGASTIVSTNLTANRALISNISGKVAVSNVTSTELGYLDGVTSAIQDQLDSKISNDEIGAANGVAGLDENAKIPTDELPDIILGQLIYGGTVTGAGVATLSDNAKTKLGTTSSTITLTNDATAITGYTANEGIYYIVSTDSSFASLELLVGDWLISTGSSWQKIDNTDAVSSVNGKTGIVTLTASDVSALPSNTTYVSTVNGSSGAVTIPNSSSSLTGLMTSTQYTKLAGIADNATANTLTLNGAVTQNPSWYAPTSAASDEGQVLFWSSAMGQPMWMQTPGSADNVLKLGSGGGIVWSSGYVQAVTLNGTSTTSPSFYAPTSAGTSGYILQSSGSGEPSWAAFPGAIKNVVTNDALTPTSGICEWTIDLDALGYADYDVIISIYDNSTGEQVLTDVYINGSIAEVYIVSDSTIAADTYKAVIIG